MRLRDDPSDKGAHQEWRNQRRTSRYSRRVQHHDFSWHEFFVAGRAAELAQATD
jgi:hypothetical protein